MLHAYYDKMLHTLFVKKLTELSVFIECFRNGTNVALININPLIGLFPYLLIYTIVNSCLFP